MIENALRPAVPAQTTRCLSCDRPLRDAQSIARGRGPVCYRRHLQRVTRVVNNCSDAQIAKAMRLLSGEGDRLVRRGFLFLVKNSQGQTRYECAPTGECSCTGAAYGRRCYHTIAAELAV